MRCRRRKPDEMSSRYICRSATRQFPGAGVSRSYAHPIQEALEGLPAFRWGNDALCRSHSRMAIVIPWLCPAGGSETTFSEMSACTSGPIVGFFRWSSGMSARMGDFAVSDPFRTIRSGATSLESSVLIQEGIVLAVESGHALTSRRGCQCRLTSLYMYWYRHDYHRSANSVHTRLIQFLSGCHSKNRLPGVRVLALLAVLRRFCSRTSS